ncbi:hypothetical protein ACERII_02050 [Evansella sp. AB-rgal1]|uniref:hypothetical protein n=1 Tax=Evansella sp. AB-rgal1 TaxID=3242696 RepID=UPI00359DE757
MEEQKIINLIRKSYEAGNLDYILSYVDKHYWYKVLKSALSNVTVDNITDFSYSKCFSIYLYPDNKGEFGIGSEELKNYINKNKNFICINLLVSAIAPFAVIKYNRFYFSDGESMLHEQYEPLDEETLLLGNKVKEVLSKHRINLLDEDILNIEIPNLSLDLKEEGVTVYHCLFEDSY